MHSLQQTWFDERVRSSHPRTGGIILTRQPSYNDRMQSTALSTALAIGAQPHRTILLRHDLPDGLAGTGHLGHSHADVGALMEKNLDHGHAVQRLRLDFLDVADVSRQRVLAEGSDAFLGEVTSSRRDATSPVPAWEIAVSWRDSAGAVDTQGLRLVNSNGEFWHLSKISSDSRSSDRGLISNVETVLDIPRYTK